MKVIKNGVVLTMDGAVFENGYVAVDGGKIVSAGEGDFDADEVFDAKGGYIVPGLIDAHSHIGMWSDGAGVEGDDGNEETDPVTPQLRAIDAINPFDYAFREALCSGVTTVVTGPGSANPIGGQFAAIKCAGRRVDDMIIKAPCAMKMAFGENPKFVYRGKNQSPSTRMGTAAVIREALFEAKEYLEKKRRHEEDSECDAPDFDIKLEALGECLEGGLLVKAHAHRADDIFTALRIRDEFNLNMTIEHCTEGHLIADILANENVGVCVGPVIGDRGKPELANMSGSLTKSLFDAGVLTAIITDHPETPEKLLSLCAAMVHKSGLGRDAALAAITINAARLCGIDSRVGSISIGKDADIAVFDSHPLDFGAKAVAVMVNGGFVEISKLLVK